MTNKVPKLLAAGRLVSAVQTNFDGTVDAVMRQVAGHVEVGRDQIAGILTSLCANDAQFRTVQEIRMALGCAMQENTPGIRPSILIVPLMNGLRNGANAPQVPG